VILCLQFICVGLSEYIIVERKRKRSGILAYFMDSGCRRRKKIMKKEDGNFVKKRRVRKKDGDDCARILTWGDRPDFD